MSNHLVMSASATLPGTLDRAQQFRGTCAAGGACVLEENDYQPMSAKCGTCNAECHLLCLTTVNTVPGGCVGCNYETSNEEEEVEAQEDEGVEEDEEEDAGEKR